MHPITTAPPAVARPSLIDWPGLAQAPSGLRARLVSAVTRRLFELTMARLDVSVHLDQHVLGRGGPAMRIERPDEFFARLGRDGLIGFGESYMTGSWSAPDLGGFLTVLAAEMATLVPEPLQRLRAAYVRRPPAEEESSTQNSRHNIAHHYDLSNDLFATFLDDSWSYSSALFARPDEPMLVAQHRKIDRLLDETGVGRGARVLEIGTGWGELAIRAAARGARVHSITLSTEQLSLARERIAEAGVSDLVTVELCDYRELPANAQYDAVLSVEMIEAVGHRYWPDYFATLRRCVAPSGRIGLQAITMPHDRMLRTRGTWTWINKYVFPGGFLPSVTEIHHQAAAAGLRVVDDLGFGASYAETLRRWDEACTAAADEIAELGFDETFRRMWHFYLEYSRAGFASGYIDVHQMVLVPTEATTPTN